MVLGRSASWLQIHLQVDSWSIEDLAKNKPDFNWVLNGTLRDFLVDVW